MDELDVFGYCKKNGNDKITLSADELLITDYTLKFDMKYRIKDKMTQKELAEKMQLYGIDLNKNSLQKVERGDRIIKEYELAVFCEVLNVSADELLKDCTENLLK